MSDYRKDPRINASRLKLFSGGIDPKIARHIDSHPSESSGSMSLGSAVHDAIEHGGVFSDLVVICPFDSYRTKEAKEWKVRNSSNIILKECEAEQALVMARNVLDCAPSWMFEVGVKHEQDFYVGNFKALLDLVTPCGIGVDWKTTAAKSKEEFIRSCWKYGYALQAYHYSMVADLKEFWFVAVSSVKPYPVWTFKCDESFIAYGKQEWNRAFENFTSEPEDEISDLSAPAWANQAEEQEDISDFDL